MSMPHDASLVTEYWRQSRAADRFDELCTASGSVRPHWCRVVDMLVRTQPASLDARLADAQQHIRDEGITYTIYADPQGKDRPWSLDELPLVLPAEEWVVLSAGLSQRARLLNAILADFYGEQRLFHAGIVPPEVMFGSGGWLPAAAGTCAPGGIFLHNYAADLMRAPDGQWWVVGDRTQAPSGAGYALENRMIMMRAFPELLAQMPVASLNEFFAALRESLVAQAPCGDESPRVVVLTPGPLNETYYEHSLLARYLGFPLVEGGDLTVRDGYVWLKTINGLQRVHAILRRQDDVYCDPLELRSDSALGVAGLTECARRGNVLMANAMGSGVVESAALQGFLPAACRFLLEQELALPSLATWWCGESAAMHYVHDHLDDLVIKSTQGLSDFAPIFGQDLDATARQKLFQKMEANPERFVAQEWVRLSHAPVLNRTGGKVQLDARSIGLRAYAVSSGQDYYVMPGGLTRVESYKDARVVAMQRGGVSKDTWVLRPAETLAVHGSLSVWVGPAVLSRTDVPSRVAENLFWMGRYTERAECMARLLRLAINARLNHAKPQSMAALHQLIWQLGLVAWGQPVSLSANEEANLPMDLLVRCATHPSHAQGLAQTLQLLWRAGFSLRDRISLDHWRAMHRLASDEALTPAMTLGSTLVWLDRAVAGLAAISGFSLDAMNRDVSWRFLSLGRRLERLQSLLAALDVALLQLQSVEGVHLDWLLALTESSGTFRKQSAGLASWLAIRSIVLLDETNPRSLRFQIDGVQQALLRLKRDVQFPLVGLARSAELLHAWAEQGLPEIAQIHAAILAMRDETHRLCEGLTNRHFTVNEAEEMIP